MRSLKERVLGLLLLVATNPVVFAAQGDLQEPAQEKGFSFVKFIGAIAIFLVLLGVLLFPLVVGIWWSFKRYTALQQQAERGGQDPGLRLYLEPGGIMITSAIFNLVWYSLLNKAIPLVNYLNQFLQAMINMVVGGQ